MDAWPDRLKRMRNATKPRLSQAKVAAYFNIKPVSVHQWESGRSRPDILKLPKLAQLYSVTLRDLCGEDLPFDADEISAAFQNPDQIPEEVEDQLVLLRRAWMLLGRDERRAVIAFVTTLVTTRKRDV